MVPEYGFGQAIQLKYSIGSGWQYATDSENFLGLGSGAENLKGVMSGDTIAIAELDSYASQQAVSNVTGILGICLVGWSFGGAIFGNWNTGSQIALFTGAPLTLISVGMRLSAAGELNRAVGIFNNNHRPRGSPPTATLAPMIFRRGTVGLELNLRF